MKKKRTKHDGCKEYLQLNMKQSKLDLIFELYDLTTDDGKKDFSDYQYRTKLNEISLKYDCTLECITIKQDAMRYWVAKYFRNC